MGQERRIKNIKIAEQSAPPFSGLSETSKAVRKGRPANIFLKEELGHEQANHIPIALFGDDCQSTGNCSAGICGWKCQIHDDIR